jgi:hypothetical protein
VLCARAIPAEGVQVAPGAMRLSVVGIPPAPIAGASVGILVMGPFVTDIAAVPDEQLYTKAKADPATTVAGVTVNAVEVDAPQFATKFAASVPVGTDGKYCVKVTNATTPETAATRIMPKMVLRARLNLHFRFSIIFTPRVFVWPAVGPDNRSQNNVFAP